MNKTARNIVGYLFIALYMCYTASTTLFVHTHNYDGQFVVHSHPFVMGERGALNDSHTLSLCHLGSVLNKIVRNALVFGHEDLLVSENIPIVAYDGVLGRHSRGKERNILGKETYDMINGIRKDEDAYKTQCKLLLQARLDIDLHILTLS